MAGKLTSKTKEVKALLEKELREEVYFRTHKIRNDARLIAPSPMNPGPYATGALKASAYVSTDDGEDDYEERRRDAEPLNPRIEKRGQYYDKVSVKPEHGHIKALVGFPLSYAELIEEGFYHVLGRRHIEGQRFLLRAVNENEDEFFAGIGDALKKLEDVRVVSKEELFWERVRESESRGESVPSTMSKSDQEALVLSASAEGVSIEEYITSRGGTYDEVNRQMENFGKDSRTWLEPKNVSRRQRRADQRAANIVKAQELKARRRGNQGGSV